MQIIFAGVTIAKDPSFGGTDGILGFMLPKGKQNVQIAEFMRAADAVPIGRGNRKRTLTGQISPKPSPTLGAAMLARMAVYDNLPQTGILILQESTTVVTCMAVLETFDEVKEQMEGVSFAHSLVFQVGKISDISADVILNKNGSVILNKDGSAQIQNK